MYGKKLASLGLVLALVYSISLPARAELLKNFKTDGSVETRSFGIDNETDRNGTADDYRSETNIRFMLGANFDLLDDVHSRLMVDRTSRFGDTGTTGNNLNGIESTLLLDNAYVKVDKVFGMVDTTIGRQFYGDSNDLNIYFGPQNDDLLSVTSVDLFRADALMANGWLKFTGIAGKTVDAAWPARGTNTDSTLYGGELGTDKLIPAGNLAAYFYNAQTHAVKAGAVGNNTLSVAGVRATGDILAGLGYHAELIQDFGRNNSVAGTPAYHGNAWFVGAHYGHDLDAMPFRAKLEFGRGSDDFVAIAPGARFGIIWGEFSNFGPSTLNGVGGAGLSNLRVFDGGLGINPIAKLGIDFNAYRFIYDEALTTPAGKTSAGTEYDLILSWKHSDNVSFDVNAATFKVGDALQNVGGVPTNPITELGADVKIKF